jgi:AbrB family looped-hinge helix DNA binding protein
VCGRVTRTVAVYGSPSGSVPSNAYYSLAPSESTIGCTSLLAKVGKRGAIIVPAKLRKRFGIEEGSLVTAEEREDGIASVFVLKWPGL